MARFTGQIALVMGAGRKHGIGHATALRLAQEGADVAICDIAQGDSEGIDGWNGIHSVADEIRALGRRAIAIECDVSKAAEVEAAFAKVSQELGTPTAVVNNASVGGDDGSAPLSTLDDETWNRTLDVNLTGTFLLCKAAASRMIEKGLPGSIVNVTSTSARMPNADFGAYATSQFAVTGYSRQLAMELGEKKIRINCVCPGATATDKVNNPIQDAGAFFGDDSDLSVSGVPLKRQSESAEQAAVIAMLLSKDASFVTGQSVNVNGGIRMD